MQPQPLRKDSIYDLLWQHPQDFDHESNSHNEDQDAPFHIHMKAMEASVANTSHPVKYHMR